MPISDDAARAEHIRDIAEILACEGSGGTVSLGSG